MPGATNKLHGAARRTRFNAAARLPDKVPQLTLELLSWFGGNARDLPWRRTRDPYAIWVSEIMLQQTQVSTVLPYYDRWMHALPTVSALAKAPLSKLYKLWEGLGYYTRVRNLQKAAQVLTQTQEGKLPANFEALLRLPGIGRYTAGAICSIAFDQPKPVLDGNVVRVLSRIFHVTDDPRKNTTRERLWDLAERLVREASTQEVRSNGHTRPGCSDLNQSLMELGALICTPQQPKCPSCPVASYCEGFRKGMAAELPRSNPRPSATAKRCVAFVVSKAGRLLVRQRPSGVVNAHFWEFPNFEVPLHVAVQPLARKISASPGHMEHLCTIRHSITRYRIRLEAYGINGTGVVEGGCWVTPRELSRLPLSSAHRKLFEHWQKRQRA